MQTAWFREQGDLRAEEGKLGQAGKLPAISWVPQTHPGWRWVRGGPGGSRAEMCWGDANGGDDAITDPNAGPGLLPEGLHCRQEAVSS